MSTSKHKQSLSAFAQDGELAQEISGFQPRPAQVKMAQAIADVAEVQGQLVVEAGTGTGKTFAYLVPAMLSEEKAIVSTGTKNLQEQLFFKDLPLVKKALGSHKTIALLKGRANYLCLYRLAQHTRHTHLVDSTALGELTKVKKWSNSTKTGDVGELDDIAEDARILPFVTSTVDNCLGRDCPDYEDCYLVKARKDAMDADLVVVNHHLFFADAALKDTGFGELIPEAQTIIFDEAHQIPDVATQYFGETVSSRQIQDMCKDIEAIQKTALKDANQLSLAAEKLRLVTADLRIMFPIQPSKGNWFEQLRREDIQSQMDAIQNAMDLLYEVTKVNLGREKALDALFERCSLTRSKLRKMLEVNQLGVSLWFETTPKHISLHLTPLSIAKKFAAMVEEEERTWVFTSATISVDGSCQHFKKQLGLNGARDLILDSPFDYQKQSLLCVPRYLPEASSKERTMALVDIAVRIVEASQGNCFLLFTSHAMMRRVAEQLEEEVDNPILVQGQTSKRVLLEQFLEEEQAVLLATGAFWEGVDVRGDKLTCVMIDKLPFASPDEPLLQARNEDARKRGENPFATMQIPQAVITMKQGAGRLIRDVKDRGVLVVCDPRLVYKDYGKTFLGSLPDMRRTRNLDEAMAFLQDIAMEPDEQIEE